MLEDCTPKDAAEQLKEWNNILILTHESPDGDTLGAAFALWNALDAMGKRARVECPDELPERFCYLYEGYAPSDFRPSFYVTVDVASLRMLGNLQECCEGRIDLNIDHHISNERFAELNCLHSKASATCEILWKILRDMKVKLTPQIATCLYTGIATDTGCFKFSNTTANAHRISGELFARGARHEFINESLFDTKSRARIAIEAIALAEMTYYFDGRVAALRISQEMIRQTGATEADLDGIASLARSIEGVDVGITLREKADGRQKVSVRTSSGVDASRICAEFGGGGHIRAAGCQINCGFEEARDRIVAASGPCLKK